MARKKVTFNINPLLSGPSLAGRQSIGSPYRELAVDEIDVDPEQPRRVFDERALGELAQSIEQFGILAPLLVRITDGGGHRLVAGERRLRAAKIAGLETVPALIVQEESEARTLAKQLTENIQREDLSPMERALAIGQLRESFGLSIRQIAKDLGISKGLVQRSLEILALPDDLQAALIAGESESKILLLGQLKDRNMRKALLERLGDLTRKELEQEIAAVEVSKVYHGGTAKKKQKKVSAADQRLIDEIQRELSTKVQITRKGADKGQGKLTLEFYSADDLDEIYRRLVG